MSSVAVALSVAALICAQTGAGTKLPPPRLWRPPVVTLLSPGEAPLAPLRYALVKGGEGQLDLEGSGQWRVKTSSNEANAPLPSLMIPFRYSVDSATQFSFEFQEARASGPTADQDHATAGILMALQGVAGNVEFDARGLAQKVSIRPSPLDPEFARDQKKVTVGTHYALELARSAFMHLLTPLPEQPIGVGASWQVERPQTRGTVSYTEVATFTLVSRDKNRAKLSVRLGGKPDPLAGVHPDQIDLSVTGTGEAELEFVRPFPVRLLDTVSIHAFTGPRESPQRVEHEGSLTGHLHLATRK